VSVSKHESATMVPGMYGNHAALDIEAGKDGYVGFLDLSPGFSSGWIVHKPQVNIISGGELAHVVARDGKFDKKCLAAPADQALTIDFKNLDRGLPHNVAIHRDQKART
jgi:hypothetical protein